MNWISRKIHLYNVTMGLYMLDWWERCLFTSAASFLSPITESPRFRYRFLHGLQRYFRTFCSYDIILGYSGLWAFLTLVDILILILLWFICYNGSRFATEFYDSYLKSGLLAGGNSAMEGVYHAN